MTVRMEVGAAFVCGALLTAALLTIGGPGTPAAPTLYSATLSRATPAVALAPRYAAVQAPAALMAAVPPTEMQTEPEVQFPAWTVTPSATGVLALYLTVAAAVGAVLGHAWRRLSRPAGLAELEAVAVPAEGEWGMAAILGKRRALSRDRKDMLEAPWSEKRKHMAVALSRELRERYNVRSMVVRKGDEVRVHSGHQKGKVGKVIQSDIGNLEVVVEGVEVKKNNGKTVSVPQMPSRLEITNLVLDDPGRVAILERRAKGRAEEAERRRQRQAGDALPGAAAAVVASP